MALVNLLETSVKLHNLRAAAQSVAGADGNTPLRNTLPVDEHRVLLIDWLEFTVLLDEEQFVNSDLSIKYWTDYIYVLVQSIGLSDCSFSLSYARNGYTLGFKHDIIGYTVMMNPKMLNMGIHFCFSGVSCARLFSELPPAVVFQLLSKYDVKYSRIDYSMDITSKITTSANRGASNGSAGADQQKRMTATGMPVSKKTPDLNPVLTMTPGRLYNEYINGNLVKRWRTVDRNVGYSGNTLSKDVVYFGSMKSDCSLRIYDKLLERRVKSESDLAGLALWIRWEFTFRHNNADALVNLFFESDWDWWLVYSSILYKMIRIVTPDSSTDSNQSRRPMHPDWSFFLASADHLEYIVPKTTSTYDSGLDYICNSVAPLLTGLMLDQAASDRIVQSVFNHYHSGKFRQFAR